MNFGEDTPASPASTLTRGESVVEEERSMSPTPDDEIQGAPKRKSGTFWKRKSILNMSNAFAGIDGKENQPQNGGLNGGSIGANGGNKNEGQNGMANGKHKVEEDVSMEDMDTEGPLPDIEEPLPRRSWSPPPQLPVFVGGGGGLGGEDLFKDIH